MSVWHLSFPYSNLFLFGFCYQAYKSVATKLVKFIILIVITGRMDASKIRLY